MKIRYECFKELPSYIDVQGFAEIIGVSKSTAYRIVKSGKIKSVRLSECRVVIFKEDLLEWIGRNIFLNNGFENSLSQNINNSEKRFLTFDELETLTNVINEDKNLSVFGIKFLLETGIRKCEMLTLKWSDIDCEKISIKLFDREIPMTKTFFKSLMQYKEKQIIAMEHKTLILTSDTYIIVNRKFERYTSNGYNRLIKRTAQNCGLSFVTTTTLRNSFGINCLKRGVDIPTLSYIMGDRNIQITEKRYSKFIAENNGK